MGLGHKKQNGLDHHLAQCIYYNIISNKHRHYITPHNNFIGKINKIDYKLYLSMEDG